MPVWKLYPVFCGFFLFTLLGNEATATHNRAGEITFICINPATNTYQCTVTTYTSIEPGVVADRPTLELEWGDGKKDTLSRQNGPDTDNDGIPDGEVIVPDKIKMNIYIGTHSYTGPGIYCISVEDPNRNEGVLNISESVQTPFYIGSCFLINPDIICNNSPQLLQPPIDNACLNQPYAHNPGAFDADGDSISYELVPCKGANGQDIPGYVYPDAIPQINNPNNVFSINPLTGEVTWISPQRVGEYNIAIRIDEWRKVAGAGVLKIGYIIRDMQIDVISCTNNPPVIQAATAICTDAGDTLRDTVFASDTDGDNISQTATGGPMLLSDKPATFVQLDSSSSAYGLFYWETACSHVRKQPWQVTFKAIDDASPVPLPSFHSLTITVAGPALQNPATSPSGNTIQLSWNPSSCPQVVCYKIYRRNGEYGFAPGPCETGVPAYTGYLLIAEVSGLNNTSFIDDNNGVGLYHGVKYCYMIVACYPDGAESYASVEFCQELIRDVPIITHVSVGKTDAMAGLDTMRWAPPTEMDTVKYPGPYHYQIYRSPGFTSAGTLVGITPVNYKLNQTDTVFIDGNINTAGNAYTYKVELYSDTMFAGSSHNASSVFLSITPADNQLILSWKETVPWFNSQYVIFKFNEINSVYEPLDTVSSQSYTDNGLQNAKEYCYFIKSIGSYSVPGIINPIINYSQQVCSFPVDLTPPCPPVLSTSADCEAIKTLLSWNNPNSFCADDVVKYNIYYTPLFGGTLQLIGTVTGANNTTFSFEQSSVPISVWNQSIAGCYAVSALDSLIAYSSGSRQNESSLSDTVCVDNCPFYELPNVFTPDGSGVNDFFVPFPYRFIQSIDLNIYNRWGQVVFHTTDSRIRWDGRHIKNHRDCTDGVYYYICHVNEIHLEGIRTGVLTGFVHLLRSAEKVESKE